MTMNNSGNFHDEEPEVEIEESKTKANGSNEDEGQREQQYKYTDEDVDKIVAKKIAKERKRYAKMFESESNNSELEERERNVTRRELRADARERLLDDNLPVDLLDLINIDSKETFEESYTKVKAVYEKSFTSAMREQFKGFDPKRGAGDLHGQDSYIKKAFSRG